MPILRDWLLTDIMRQTCHSVTQADLATECRDYFL